MIKTVLRYILLFSYFTVGLFLLGLLIKLIIGYIYIGKFYLPYEEVMRNFFKSIIAGSAITLAALVFNLIDKFKARKTPPSDRE
ncbi:hypothetical protein [Erwinia pyrifoliae]|uniref:hypothetical protein n=1 Tax=Erwinia pyrifoliae TaxID=79967 RepID=UPI0021FFBE3F|nr:hypothetical protein [Erwinia pyrifoliae]MCT2386170.1 hypothetical protein [Erwinia pyrifoliae]MCU8588233.1 hypothetical protein [Erwinia pyrifoliae]UWS30008.1 hypothetical protein NYP81_00310 [Erwinia pyrifoliae]